MILWRELEDRVGRGGGFAHTICSAWGRLELDRPTKQGQSSHVTGEIPEKTRQRYGPPYLQPGVLPTRWHHHKREKWSKVNISVRLLQRKGTKKRYFKKFILRNCVTRRTGKSKIIGQANWLEPQTRVDAAVLKQNFFSRKPQHLLLRPSTD